MKIAKYILSAAAVVTLASCAGHEDYDAYVSSLQGQKEVIDTISSPSSYAAYLDDLSAKAQNFEQLGVKLNDTQKDELQALSAEIQQALIEKYNSLCKDLSEKGDTVFTPESPVEQVVDGEVALSGK